MKHGNRTMDEDHRGMTGLARALRSGQPLGVIDEVATDADGRGVDDDLHQVRFQTRVFVSPAVCAGYSP
ncbi:hypothetical protein EDD92_8177 [Streptomyces sp. TLI_185]|nr:hypothetical protein EDD92_8177 [Streptomyces sp. TLI_185]